jgi:hypothetical protein
MTDGPKGETRWRRAFYVMLCAWMVTLLGASYLFIDSDVTYTYFEDACRQNNEDFAILRRLAPALRKGDSQREVLSTLRTQNPDGLIVEHVRQIQTGQLVLGFDDQDRLDSITTSTTR